MIHLTKLSQRPHYDAVSQNVMDLEYELYAASFEDSPNHLRSVCATYENRVRKRVKQNEKSPPVLPSTQHESD